VLELGIGQARAEVRVGEGRKEGRKDFPQVMKAIGRIVLSTEVPRKRYFAGYLMRNS